MAYTSGMKQLDPKSTWLFFIIGLGRGLPIILVLFFMWLSLSSDDQISQTIGNFMWLAPLGILFVVGISWVWAKLSYHFYRYELREDGFRKESGIIWKKYTTIPYGRIQNVEIYRGLVARILGLSDLHVQTAGGVAQARYGTFSEGRIPGLLRADAEIIRDQLVRRTEQTSNKQGL
jgi:uncharacterized membrane protein YdbT with pleckstrin-like domain